MASISETYFQNAQLSMAAYAVLTVEMNVNRSEYISALELAGFSESLAMQFAATS
jgi:hypothetical protein